MNLPQQRERVTVDGLGNVGVGKYTENVEKSEKSGIMNVRFNTVDDPMREVTGVGLKTNPKEIKSIIDDVTSLGSEIETEKTQYVMNRGFVKVFREELLLIPKPVIALGCTSILTFLMTEKTAIWE